MMRAPAGGWCAAAVAAIAVSGCFGAEAPRPREPAMPVGPEARAQRTLPQRDRDPALRSEAVLAIDDLDDAADTAVIAQALSDPDRGVRRAAILSLVGTGDDLSAAWLALALNDTDPRIRLDAVEALGAIGSDAARTALLQAQTDSDAVVRAAAAEMLAEPARRRR